MKINKSICDYCKEDIDKLNLMEVNEIIVGLIYQYEFCCKNCVINWLNLKKTLMPFGRLKGTPIKDLPKDYICWLVSSGCFDKSENEELKKIFIEEKLI